MSSVDHSENIRAQKEESTNHLERKPMQTSLSIESSVTLCVCPRKLIFFVIWSSLTSLKMLVHPVMCLWVWHGVRAPSLAQNDNIIATIMY